MFLIERLVSLTAYAAVLLIACGLMGLVRKKQYKLVLGLYLLCLGVFAFAYKPYKSADLYRLREYIQYWIHGSWAGMIRQAIRHSSPAWVVFSYVTNRLGNINWMQTVACLWCFGNIFYLISHEIERKKLVKAQRSLLLFFVMAVGALFLQTISGIRSMLGISIIAFCVYRETVEGKSLGWHLLLYLFAALLHTSTLVLVLSRFAVLFLQYRDPKMKILMAVSILFLGLFALFYLRDYVSSAVANGLLYLTNRKEYTYGWEILIGLLEALETVLILHRYRKHKACRDRAHDSLWSFCAIWTAVSLAAAPFSYAIFRRYTIFCTLIVLPLLAKIMQEEQEKNRGRSRFLLLLWTLSLAVFALSWVRGDLCGYKFFVL